MPEAARPAGNMRRRACLSAAAICLLAITVILANPFASRATATTIPIVYPLEKRVKLLHDYLAPRVGHLHQGTDLMAAKMTKEIACVSGTVYLRQGTYAGVPSYSIWLAGDDGHGYFYIHINNDTPGTDDGAGGYRYAFAPGLTNGAHVTQGQHIAYVGDSGNAESTGPHLHFEIHATTSMSSASIDPYDSVAAAPLYGGTAVPEPSATRYEQTNSNILYLGKWVTFTASASSGGSYKYADSAAKAVISFNGTKLDLIGTKGTTQGKAKVYLDGEDKGVIDFSNATTLRKQLVWSTGTVASGTHTVELCWLGQKGMAGRTRINIDAVNVTGSLAKAALTTVEQTGDGLHYDGVWGASYSTASSGGSSGYANRSGAKVTIHFTGSYLVWLSKKSPAYGIARVTVDRETPVYVDLFSATTRYQQKVWSTKVLAEGPHTVIIEWTGRKNYRATSKNIGIDAVQVLGEVD